ncbi:outer membrane protein [Bradyrhizobium sp.]|uniref:outer membrane protein n=1 Tax=Bradyrhizobium sp. TaxID=376 RepID=UPI003C550980
MKTHFGWAVASTLLMASMGAAQAADMSMPMKAPPPAVPAPTWTGCYLDAGIGYSVWNNDQTLTGPFGGGGTLATAATTRAGGNGWLGRIGGGCDWQLSGELSRWVIGGFADYDLVSARGSFTPNEVFNVGGGFQPVSANVKQNGTGYVGARVGYIALPGLLTYVNAGWTGTRFSQGGEFATAFGAPIGFNYPGWTNNNGWFVGGGTEYALPWFNGLFLRSEYRYASYGNRNLAEVNTTTGVLTGNVQSVKTIDQTATTSLVWKFNWGSPVVAKY